MKKIFSVMFLCLLIFQLAGCTSVPTEDLKTLRTDDVFVIQGVNYDMTFDEVVNVLKLSKEDTLGMDTEDNSVGKYNHYVREGYKFCGQECMVTLQFVNDKLFGMAIGFQENNKDLKALYDDIKKEMLALYKDPVKVGEKTEMDNGYSYEDTEWVLNNTKMLLSATYAENEIPNFSINISNTDNAMQAE